MQVCIFYLKVLALYEWTEPTLQNCCQNLNTSQSPRSRAGYGLASGRLDKAQRLVLPYCTAGFMPNGHFHLWKTADMDNADM